MRLEVEGVVLGYDHIVSYINSKQKILNVNYQFADKLAEEGGLGLEGSGGGSGDREKIIWLYGLWKSCIVRFKSGFFLNKYSVVLKILWM